MSRPLCLMVVHAHPDDEVIPTGGLLARCADEGITTVLVTCTDGSQGFGPDFVNSGEPGHSPVEVAATRRTELEQSCAILGVTHLEMLGYGDSGMEGWASNKSPRAFCNANLSEAATRLEGLIFKHRPDVIVTYANNGGSGHPDHINTHLVTLLADDLSSIASKVYFVIRSDEFNERVRRAREISGTGDLGPEARRRSERPSIDHLITTVIDTNSAVARKHAALHAHASQLQRSHWFQIDLPALEEIFGEETYIRARDKTGAPLPETDVFAGLRGEFGAN